jgi:hypothetical protein
MSDPVTKADGPVRVRDMPWRALAGLLRTIGPEIGTLARRGDQLAQAVMARYHAAYEHPRDPRYESELRVALEDYVNRDLRLAEQYELASRFGHRLPEPEKPAGIRVLLAGSERSQ